MFYNMLDMNCMDIHNIYRGIRGNQDGIYLDD